MRRVHYITIASAIIVIAFLYWGVNTNPPAKKMAEDSRNSATPGTMPPGSNTMKPASFDSIVAASNAQLPKTAADEVKTIENELAAIRDSSQMAAVFVRLAHLYETNKQQPVAAYYGAKAAKLENSEKKLNFAAQFFLELMHDSSATQSMQLWEAQEAIACLQRSIALNPQSDSAKLLLASAYIEGTGETMQGVQLLLGITREKPEDIPANLMLGKLAVQSGQFDKAVGRFETILKQQPKNTEALYFLAESYKGKGDKGKAIALFEQCKAVVNNPEFSKEIDNYINTFK